MSETLAKLLEQPAEVVEFVGSLLLAEGFVREGFLDLPGLSDASLPDEIRKLVKTKFIHGDETLSLSFDHTDELLKKAKEHFDDKQLDLTCLFYMLVIEHRVNHVLRSVFRRRKVPEAEALQIVRKLSVREKATWLFKMLGIPPMPEDLSARMTVIEEYRNSYVHFKWVARYGHEDETWIAVIGVKDILDWITKVENEHVFFGQRGRLALACKRLIEQSDLKGKTVGEAGGEDFSNIAKCQ
jgi:hypothetical protein